MRDLRDRQTANFYPDSAPFAGSVTHAERANALLRSEYRGIAALNDALATRVEEIASSTTPTEVKEARFTQLFRGCSKQLELLHTALIREVGSHELDSSPPGKVAYLIMALRTYLEEAILPLGRRSYGWQADCVNSAKYTLALMRKECALLEEFDLYTKPKPGGLEIKEFDLRRLQVDQSLLTSLREICEDLVIDKDRLEPQEGFGRVISAEELAHDLDKPGTRLLVPYQGEEPAGLFLLSDRAEAFPSAAVATMRRETSSNVFPALTDGWVDLIAISKVARRASHAEGVSTYRILTSAVVESALARGLERLWCEVRRGTQANTAYEKHLAVGWKSTGIFHQHDGHPYEILQLDLTQQRLKDQNDRYTWWYYPSERTDWLEQFDAVSGLSRNFSYCNLDSARVPDFDPQLLNNLTLTIRELEAQVNSKLKYKRGMEDDCIVIYLEPEQTISPWRELAVKQKVPGKDLWKVEDPIYYELGLLKPMLPLAEVVSKFGELCR